MCPSPPPVNSVTTSGREIRLYGGCKILINLTLSPIQEITYELLVGMVCITGPGAAPEGQ